jgi:hypothetical protein
MVMTLSACAPSSTLPFTPSILNSALLCANLFISGKRAFVAALTNEFGLRWSDERGHLLLGEVLLAERVDLVSADAFIEGFSDRQV